MPKYITIVALQQANISQYKEAIADFDKAIELDPQDATAYDNRLTKDDIDYYGAIADFDKAIDRPAICPSILRSWQCKR